MASYNLWGKDLQLTFFNVPEEIRQLLIKNGIIKLLLDHIPDGDSDLQCKIISTLLAFITQAVNPVPDHQNALGNYPW